MTKESPALPGRNLSQGTGRYAGMLLIPGGPFEMGSTDKEVSPDERPAHKVFVKSFHLAQHPVTVQMYCEFLNAEGERTSDRLPRVRLDIPGCPVIKEKGKFEPKAGCADRPMVCVSWYGASEYAQWAGGRLPTAAEWEKAANLHASQNHADTAAAAQSENSATDRDPKGIRGSNGMLGNVWEWCSDWYSREYYRESPKENPTGPPLGQEKEIRGGSHCAPEASRRIQNRHKAVPGGHFHTVGFRIVKD